MARSKPFPTVYRIVGLSQQVWGYRPQMDPLWVIFAHFDNLAPPGELVCVCGASVLPPADSTSQSRQLL